MNGVCVTWVGWIDLEQLTGKARLVYNEDYAKVSRWEGGGGHGIEVVLGGV